MINPQVIVITTRMVGMVTRSRLMMNRSIGVRLGDFGLRISDCEFRVWKQVPSFTTVASNHEIRNSKSEMPIYSAKLGVPKSHLAWSRSM